MLPEEAGRPLDDVTSELVREAGMPAGRVQPLVQDAIGALVWSVKLSLFESDRGHDTRPRDSDRALVQDFSAELRKLALRLEAVAHIAVQQRIDLGDDPRNWPSSRAYVKLLHRAFRERPHDESLWIESSGTGERLRAEPGKLSRRTVVGVPPYPTPVPRTLPQTFQAGLQSGSATPNPTSRGGRGRSPSPDGHTRSWTATGASPG